jgi:hypothetical protein
MQTSYSYQAPAGVAGGLIDLRPYSIVSRMNGEDSVNAMRFGMGVMRGENPGSDILVPKASMAANQFEGISMNSFTQQMGLDGKVPVYPKQTVGLLRWGCAWARVKPGISPEYGDKCYLITSGADAGLFANEDPGAGNGIAVNAMFIGSLGTGDIAPVELFNQMAE